MKSTAKESDRELKFLMQMKDAEIDTSDVPEVEDWSNAVIGKFYRPIKEPVTIRLDADVVAWLKAGGPGYQTRVNAFLRVAMIESPWIVGDGSVRGVARCEELPGSGGTRDGCHDLRFPSLEKQQKLDKYCSVARLIEQRGSVFALAA